MNVEVIRTGDGSDSLYVPSLDEHYHSIHGAVNEAMHVFIKGGLLQVKGSQIRIFEVGFGTGLNTLLTLLESTKRQLRIEYHSIDRYRLPNDITSRINYPAILGNKSASYFEKIHQAPWNRTVIITPEFHLKKILADIHTFQWEDQFNVCYYDAFAPDKQPDMWLPELLEQVYLALEPGGILVTYSAKGSVRRALGNIGFDVERKPGPEGKKHMTCACKPAR